MANLCYHYCSMTKGMDPDLSIVKHSIVDNLFSGFPRFGYFVSDLVFCQGSLFAADPVFSSFSHRK